MWCHLSIYWKLHILLLGWTKNRYIIVRLIILLTFYSENSFEISSSKKEQPLWIPFEVFWAYYFDVYTIWLLSVVGVCWRRELDPKLHFLYCFFKLRKTNPFPVRAFSPLVHNCFCVISRVFQPNFFSKVTK